MCTLLLFFMYIYIIINVQEVDLLMKVNTTELRTHLSDYLTMANKEEIIITNKGIEIARIISPKQAKKRSLNNLVGILPSLTDKEIENIKNERISKQNNLVGILPSLTDKEIENIKNERISKQ